MMELSLSVRVAEAPTKDRLTMPFDDLARLAAGCGYRHLCLRASAAGVQTPVAGRAAVRRTLDALGLKVSMATTDVDVPLNNDQGPANLRNIGPHLEVAEQLGATLIRVCLKQPEDIAFARQAADLAQARGIRLAHQCHTNSLFETVDQMLGVLEQIDRPNFGLIYEPANLMLCGQPYGLETLERLAPHLMNVYVQNHRLADDGDVCLPTRVRGPVRYHDIPLWVGGGVDFDRVFSALKQIGYQGTVTVHQHYARIMPAEEAVERSHQFLAEQIAR